MLITEDYRRQNAEIHAKKPHYGSGGVNHAQFIIDLAKQFDCETMLDYGCGKGTLVAKLNQISTLVCHEYDPCITEKSTKPFPADLVTCTDVLEHIEPECLDEVLDDMASLARRVLFVTVHIGPAAKHLPDGRNHHLIQQHPRWWLEKLQDRMDLKMFEGVKNGFMAVLTHAGV